MPSQRLVVLCMKSVSDAQTVVSSPPLFLPETAVIPPRTSTPTQLTDLENGNSANRTYIVICTHSCRLASARRVTANTKISFKNVPFIDMNHFFSQPASSFHKAALTHAMPTIQRHLTFRITSVLVLGKVQKGPLTLTWRTTITNCSATHD